MNFLEKLMNAHGVSGSEELVREIIEKEIRPHVSSAHVDSMGNLVAVKKGAKPTVLLAAHMDEVGLMAKTILETGETYFSAIGNLRLNSIVGQRVIVHGNGPVHGIITTRMMSNDWDFSGEKEQLHIHDLFVDTGLTKKELEAKGVLPGSVISLVQDTGYLANGKYVFGKALDDRVGCYVLVELAKRLRKTGNEIVFLFTVQEEVGLYGSRTAAFELRPDWAIAVDVSNANDCLSEKTSKRLGGGPCITVKDADMLANKCINGWLSEIAKKKKISVQHVVSDSGTTDALSISLSRGGVPSSVIGIAVRNMHSTVGIAYLQDIVECIGLLEELLKNPPKTCLV